MHNLLLWDIFIHIRHLDLPKDLICRKGIQPNQLFRRPEKRKVQIKKVIQESQGFVA